MFFENWIKIQLLYESVIHRYCSLLEFEDDFEGTIDETHFQESTPNQKVFFLDRELYLFEVQDLYADGRTETKKI